MEPSPEPVAETTKFVRDKHGNEWHRDYDEAARIEAGSRRYDEFDRLYRYTDYVLGDLLDQIRRSRDLDVEPSKRRFWVEGITDEEIDTTAEVMHKLRGEYKRYADKYRPYSEEKQAQSQQSADSEA